MKRLAIIGGGPAALMLATQLDTKKYEVTLFEKNKTVGRKFLVAGDGGLNLTYNAPLKQLLAQYVPSNFTDSILTQFSNKDLINWLNKLGVPTFIGSSNRVFPNPNLKPIEVLNKIVAEVRKNNVNLQLNKKWIGWNEKGDLRIEESENIKFDIVVFALGGASWKVTGSDGMWQSAFEERGVIVNPFRSANCSFEVAWKKDFIKTHAGKPLKNISLQFNNQVAKGELVITAFGLEGNAIYALSQKIQDALLSEKSVVVNLDLKPQMTVDQVKSKYKKSNYAKVTQILSETLNLNRAAIGLLKQFSDKATFLDIEKLAEVIKCVPIVVNSAGELEKAISSLGGIDLKALDSNFQLNQIPNTYVIGEMLDWFAPTGGYLLQACFSMGFVLAAHLNSGEVNRN